MNVFVISAVFPPEPVVSSLLSFDIAEALEDNGNHVTVICPEPTRPYGYKFSINNNADYKFRKVVLDSYTFPKSKLLGRLRESFSFGKQCARYIKENVKQTDVVYANTWPFFAQYFIIKVACKYNIPLILHIQDIYPESVAEKQAALIRWFLLLFIVPLDKYFLRKCSKIITVSSPMKEFLVRSRQLDDTKVFVVRNWQNDNKFLDVYDKGRSKNSEFIFMFLGNLSPSAGVETLIHAYGKANLSNSRLIIAGEGSDKPYCLKTASLYPDKNIEFITAPVEDVPTIQQRADVLVLTLRKGIAKTATPSKLTAYMFSGKPILACVDEESDTADCILNSRCGFVVEPENQEKLTITLMNIVKLDKLILDEFGKNSLNYAVENLSREVNLRKIVSLIS